ncbi:hypothetical protein [Staphylococcus gallinarum]|nr:hypothetical protein [Staphylococcus gallinarum]PTK90418.1 hypothetical protein BUZ05_10595 [Staphylococcus gallinarum]PTK92609.1 hypothetical protein BUZ13_07855 [Staphylococcus gallinarum]RIO87577.1 hypothetical protein BUZ06_10350 [Staphylococcus gallinarum]
MGINSISNYGILNSITIILFVIFIVFLAIFIYRELTIKTPMLNLKIFKNLKVTTLLLSFLVLGGSTSIIFIVPPYYLERLKHMSSWKVGLINLFTPLAIAVFSQISGNYSGKLGNINSLLIANNETNLIRGFSYSWLFAFCTLFLMLLLIIINGKYRNVTS